MSRRAFWVSLGVPLSFLGALWTGAWFLVLWAVVSPWDDLGGIVSQRLRWLERFALAMGLIAGSTAGGYARDACRPGTGRTHRRLLRLLLMPQATATALVLIVLARYGHEPGIGIATTGFIAWWAGVDLAIGAWPLLGGRDYRFHGPIAADPEPDADPADQASGDPWDRM